MITKKPGPKPHTVQVTFAVPSGTWAERICLVGEFNDWNRSSHPLFHGTKEDPDWQITLVLESGHTYQFRYLMNNTVWCTDCAADSYVEHPYGKTNSVVVT